MTTNTTVAVAGTSLGVREVTMGAVRKVAAAVATRTEIGDLPGVKTEGGAEMSTKTIAGGVIACREVVGETGAHHLQKEPEGIGERETF